MNIYGVFKGKVVNSALREEFSDTSAITGSNHVRNPETSG